MSEQKKRKTVNVRNDLGRPIMLHLHQTVADDGGGRPFEGRVLSDPNGLMPDAVQLRVGHNPGIDKEFFAKWAEQNPGLAPLFISQDEPEPESAQREENDDGSRRDANARQQAEAVPGRLLLVLSRMTAEEFHEMAQKARADQAREREERAVEAVERAKVPAVVEPEGEDDTLGTDKSDGEVKREGQPLVTETGEQSADLSTSEASKVDEGTKDPAAP